MFLFHIDASVGVGREMEEFTFTSQHAQKSQPKRFYYKQLQLNQNYLGGSVTMTL
ncbi:hypothetical protein KHA80_14345 [Anaerobacillus sp. HL2]|nr:hypothetical protein KHA80_14345 [Anaerobacillus sp. HL2]